MQSGNIKFIKHEFGTSVSLSLQNNRIAELEKELKALEDQIIEIRNNTSEQVTEEKRHIESLHSHEQVLKSKVRHIQNMSVSMSTFD